MLKFPLFVRVQKATGVRFTKAKIEELFADAKGFEQEEVFVEADVDRLEVPARSPYEKPTYPNTYACVPQPLVKTISLDRDISEFLYMLAISEAAAGTALDDDDDNSKASAPAVEEKKSDPASTDSAGDMEGYLVKKGMGATLCVVVSSLTAPSCARCH